MVYVKSALKCHTAHTTVFFFIFLFDFIFFALMERVRGPSAGSEVRGHRPGVQTATKGSSQSALGRGRLFPAGTSGSSQVRDTE